VHRSEGEAVASKAPRKAPAQSTSLWDGWEDASSSMAAAVHADEEDEDLDLGAMGL
jgi:hypothetical protein